MSAGDLLHAIWEPHTCSLLFRPVLGDGELPQSKRDISRRTTSSINTNAFNRAAAQHTANNNRENRKKLVIFPHLRADISSVNREEGAVARIREKMDGLPVLEMGTQADNDCTSLWDDGGTFRVHRTTKRGATIINKRRKGSSARTTAGFAGTLVLRPEYFLYSLSLYYLNFYIFVWSTAGMAIV